MHQVILSSGPIGLDTTKGVFVCGLPESRPRKRHATAAAHPEDLRPSNIRGFGAGSSCGGDVTGITLCSDALCSAPGSSRPGGRVARCQAPPRLIRVRTEFARVTT